jgi:hypothetical protein
MRKKSRPALRIGKGFATLALTTRFQSGFSKYQDRTFNRRRETEGGIFLALVTMTQRSRKSMVGGWLGGEQNKTATKERDQGDAGR